MALTMMWGLRFQFDSQDVPTGLAHFVDLTFLSKPGVMAWVTGVFAVLCVPYVFAQGLVVVLPLLTLIHCSVFAFFNSQGYKSHGNQIISLILLAQAAVVVFFAAHRWIKGRPFPLRAGRTRDSYLIYYSQVVIAGVYMTSVVSKLDVSNFRWVQNLPNMSVQLVKTHRQEFYSKPETSTVRRDAEVPAARWMIDHPHQTRLPRPRQSRMGPRPRRQHHGHAHRHRIAHAPVLRFQCLRVTHLPRERAVLDRVDHPPLR